MKKKNKILFFGKFGDQYSKKLLSYLKNNFSNVKYVASTTHDKSINKKILEWSGDYIFSFRSYFILPESLIKSAKIAAINFHPGPPNYRGIGCVNFALYNEERTYGVIAHLMKKKIDNGEILKYTKFSIKHKTSLEEVLNKTHFELYKLAMYFFKKIYLNKLNIKKCINKNRKINWSKKIYTKQDMLKLYNLNIKINKKEFKKIIKATVYKNFMPHITIFNKRFIYTNDK